jgi:hypothetical protein
MEYRKTRFEVRACGHPNRWEWAVDIGGRTEQTGQQVSRQAAVAASLRYIDEWLANPSDAAPATSATTPDPSPVPQIQSASLLPAATSPDDRRGGRVNLVG